jgi:hypothetical protein
MRSFEQDLRTHRKGSSFSQSTEVEIFLKPLLGVLAF